MRLHAADGSPPAPAREAGANPARRKRRWPRLVFAFVVFPILVGGAMALAAPSLLERAIRARLDALGLEGAQFEVLELTPWRTVVGGVSLPKGWKLRADRVELRYELPQLLNGEVEEVIVDGASAEIAAPRRGETAEPPLGVELPKREGKKPLERLPFQKLEVRGARVRLATDEASFEVPVTATCRTRDTVAEFAVSADLDAVAGGASASVKGSFELTDGAADGSATVRVSTLRWGDGDPIDRLLRPWVHAQTAAEVRIEGRVAISGGRVSPTFNVAVDDGALREDKVALEGIDAKATVVKTDTLATRPASISWTRGRLGKVGLGAGEAVVAVESPSSISVERLGVSFEDGGRAEVEAFRFDPRELAFDVVVRAENLSLEGWLDRFAKERARGSGTLDGRISAQVRLKPRLSIVLREGFLHSDGAGRLELEDAEAVREALEKNAPALPAGQDYNRLVQERIVQSLRRFAYESLELDLVPKPDGLTLRVTTHGRGVDVPQELHLTVNFNGIDDALALALGLQQGLRDVSGRVAIGNESKGDRR